MHTKRPWLARVDADRRRRVLEFADQALIAHAVYTYLVRCVLALCSRRLRSGADARATRQQLGDDNHPAVPARLVARGECRVRVRAAVHVLTGVRRYK